MNKYPTAKPLTGQDALSMEREDLVVEVDGVPYCAEDLYGCGDCDLRTPRRSDLDEDGLCGDCAAEARREAEHVRQLRADYHAGLL